MTTLPNPLAPLFCSFCGKHEDEVPDLVQGVCGNICDTCIDLAHEIVTKARERRKAEVVA